MFDRALKTSLEPNPVDTQSKLNVLAAFNLDIVSTGYIPI